MPVRPFQRRRSYFGIISAVLGVCLVFALTLGYVSWYKSTESWVTATVTDKERVCSGSTNGNSSCKYLIYTSGTTYKDTDSWLYGKHNSSDVYGHIQRGQTYCFKVVGWRSGLFSSYQNIVEVKSDC